MQSNGSKELKIAIIGAGAMGSIFGAKLCAHAQVILIDPYGAHIQAISENGLMLEKMDGNYGTYPLRAVLDPLGGRLIDENLDISGIDFRCNDCVCGLKFTNHRSVITKCPAVSRYIFVFLTHHDFDSPDCHWNNGFRYHVGCSRSKNKNGKKYFVSLI